MRTTTDRADSDEINLKDIVETLWRGKWLILCVTIGLTSVAALAAFIVPKSYQASALIAPATSSSGGGLGNLSSIASQFGGLASLAGLSVAGDSKKSEFTAFLRSEAITETYIRENSLLPIIYATKWDAENNRWKSSHFDKQPTIWEASRRFRDDIRDVVTDSKTGLVTLTIKWKDPQLAARWANGLVKMCNDILRAKAIAESERNISYLNDEAAKTSVVEAKQAIYAILQNEINKAMLARGSEEYAFRVIDPATVPEKASFPRKTVWIIAGFVLGFVAAVIFVFIRRAWAVK
jgi:uncharacterized protein involved in exopolysaccharide biosynthesis